MDRHDIAHYVIAAALALGGGGALVHQAQKPRVVELVNANHAARVTDHLWAPLSEKQAEALTAAFKKLALPRLEVLCVDIDCDDVADDFVAAAHAAGTVATFNRSMITAPVPFSVGAVDPRLAAQLADAMAAATGLTPSVSIEPRLPGDPQPAPYVAFAKH